MDFYINLSIFLFVPLFQVCWNQLPKQSVMSNLYGMPLESVLHLKTLLYANVYVFPFLDTCLKQMSINIENVNEKNVNVHDNV